MNDEAELEQAGFWDCLDEVDNLVLVEWADRVMMPKLARMMPAIIVFAAVGLIEKEPDMGTGAVVAFIAFCMLFLGGVSKKSLTAAVCIALVGVAGL